MAKGEQEQIVDGYAPILRRNSRPKSMDTSSVAVATRSLHELAPYIGKMRPELAAWAIDQVTIAGDTVLDPFCGSGTVLLEGWSRGRQVFGLDLNPYAWLVSAAKLFPASPAERSRIDSRLAEYAEQARTCSQGVDTDGVDPWLRSFYHPATLRELLAWCHVLRRSEDAFALASLLAIAHHQRPGFLSYPASHTVPYLRTSKFPVAQFSEMYQYREVLPRLQRKMHRALRHIDSLDFSVRRNVYLADATTPPQHIGKVDAIITSPPYMGQLHYGRDNRLRLALLGYSEWHELDQTVSPRLSQFSTMLAKAFKAWTHLLRPHGKVAILIGDTTNTVKQRLDNFVVDLVAQQIPQLQLIDVLQSEIPDDRRSRKNCRGSSAELLLLFQMRR